MGGVPEEAADRSAVRPRPNVSHVEVSIIDVALDVIGEGTEEGSAGEIAHGE